MRRYPPYRISALTALIGTVLLAACGSWQLAQQQWLVQGDRPRRAGTCRSLPESRTVAGVVFALLILSESLKPLQIAGAVVIFAGIALARAKPSATPPAE